MDVSAGLIKKMGGTLVVNEEESDIIVSLMKKNHSNCIDLDNIDSIP